MANWIGSARSNYFQVKNEAAFREWAGKRDLHVMEGTKGEPPEPSFGVYSEDEYGGWPSFDQELEDETGDGRIDLASELATHLKDGEVAVLEEVGAEKLRYLTGVAVAINHTGKIVVVSIDDIYLKAADEFGVAVNQISECSY